MVNFDKTLDDVMWLAEDSMILIFMIISIKYQPDISTHRQKQVERPADFQWVDRPH